MAIVENKPVPRNMELRHLPIGELIRLSEILDNNESWTKLMEGIPKNLTDIQSGGNNSKPIQRKYSTENIR